MAKKKEPKYRVEAILKSEEFKVEQPDFLRALLSEKEEYTLSEVRDLITDFYHQKGRE